MRYLFGPVSAAYADQNLAGARGAGECKAFGEPGTDLVIAAGESWETVCTRVGWRADFVVLNPAYTTIPACLWTAPVPLVGLAGDWNLLWHWQRRCLRRCDLVLSDAAGVEVLTREGIAHVRQAHLFGCERAWLEGPQAESGRDIDVIFIGNLHPAVQRERLSWLGRLARLGQRWRVEIHSGVFGDAYRALLGRARICWNRGIRGEANKRTFEAAAAGALLFQEGENREVGQVFRDGQECVFYTDDNLEERLEYYLTHEDERRAIAEAARVRVGEYTFEALWREQVGRIEAEWGELTEWAGRRGAKAGSEDLHGRTWQALYATTWGDETLLADLAAAVVARPAAGLHNALGLAVARRAAERGAEQAAGYFQRALACDPGDVVAGLNLTETLAACGKRKEAVEQGRRTLGGLDRLLQMVGGKLAACPTGGHFPVGFDVFRVEWERAGWSNAGRRRAEGEAKAALVRWRVHAILAHCTDDLVHYHEAVAARPDLPVTRAALGAALARTNRVQEALPHLRAAVAANPFDADAARVLAQALAAAGDETGRRQLARERLLLVRAAPTVVQAERWFQEAPPVGDELASIVVLCCNEVEFTRRCLDSVLRQTRAPYELVLVDNGSTDTTPALLAEFGTRTGPARVVVLRNEVNRGFAAGCNQGLEAARGDYVVFLNNDTVVTAGWLEGLIGWSLEDWPRVGLVGAVTNYSRGPQQVPPGYTGLEGLDSFAERRRREFTGKAQAVDRLAGFCLLARRPVLQQLGGFDERYGTGFFEDDDLSVRALRAGFRLLVALGVYIHHFGSRTFAGLGINCQQQLYANFERFREKWGAAECAGYQVVDSGQWAVGSEEWVVGSGQWTVVANGEGPSPAPGDSLPAHYPLPTTHYPLSTAHYPLSTTHSPLPTVSICLIVKDEERNLADCLRSVADLAGEVIVVDTGSTDRTKEIAAGFGARVVDFPWCDSFSAARNEGIKHAGGQWIFWMDADDRVDEVNRGKLRELFAGLKDENAAYVMKCVCLSVPGTKAETEVDHVRLFRNHPQIRWEYRVHEQILPALRRTGGETRWADIRIQHTGYMDPALRARKLERDLRLLLMQAREMPDEPYTLFCLGQTYHELGKDAEALPLLKRSLERSAPGDSIVRKLFALIVQCHRRLGDKDLALAACRAGRGYHPDDAELQLLESVVLHEQGDYPGEEAALLRLMHGQEGAHFASVATGLRRQRAWFRLASLYEQQGRPAEAEALWRALLAEEPELLPAWLGLGEALRAQGRWQELEEHSLRMEAAGQGVIEALVLRALAHLGRREFGPARRILEERAIPAEPTAVWPLKILTHVLLQEGRDQDAAERALRQLLVLDAGNVEAQNNLAVLLRQRGRVA